MSIINQNPFRILGLSVIASERDIQRQITKTKRFAEVGKEVLFDADFLFFGDLKRDVASVSKASSAIQQPVNRLLHSLFWFWNANHIDAAAFENLTKGNTDKAIEIWEKVVKDGEVSSKNFSCLFNLKSLYIAQSLKDNSIDSSLFIKGVLLAGTFLNHEDLALFTKQITGEHVKISSEEIEIKYITSLYSAIKPFLGESKGISTDAFLSSFETFSKKARQHISAKFTGDPIKKIEGQISTASEFREKNPIEAFSFGETLYKNTKIELESLSKILGQSDLKYQMLANKLANEILQCGIDFFNKIREDGDETDEDGKNLLKLCKYANAVASEGQTKSRIEETIEFIDDWLKDASRSVIDALNKAIEIYESWDTEIRKNIMHTSGPTSHISNENNHKPSLVFPAKDLLDKAKKALPQLSKELENDEFLSFYDQIVQVIIALAVKYVNNYKYQGQDIECCYLFHNTLNFPMTPETKKRHTENHNIIFNNTINKIVPFAMYASREKSTSKLYNSHKGPKPGYYSGPPYGHTSTSKSSDGCYIATMVYGDYEHPQVLVLRSFRDDFLSHSLLGRSFIHFYYKYSPGWVKTLENNRLINQVIKRSLNQFIKLIK